MKPEQIKSERSRLGLTINQMADLIGVSPRAYSYYEAGQRKIPATVEKLLAVLARLDDKNGLGKSE